MLLSYEEFDAMLEGLKGNVIPGDELVADYKETLAALYECARHAKALIAFAELTALLARMRGNDMQGLANLADLYATETKKLITQLAIAENRSPGKGKL